MTDKCGVCGKSKLDGKSTSKKQNWTGCDGCAVWYHAECVGIRTDVEFELIKAKAKWFCPNCIKGSNIGRVVSGLVQENLKEKAKDAPTSSDDLEKWVASKLESMWPQITSYCDNIKAELRTEMALENSKLLERISILEKYMAQLEKREEYKDKRILMLYGIPDAIQTYDHTFLLKIAAELCIPNFSVSDVEYVVKIPSKGGNGRTSTIMVFFMRQLNRNEFMSAYLSYIREKQLNLTIFDPAFPNSRIYLNEYLSKSQHGILMKAKGMKRLGLIHKVNIRKGMIIVTVEASGTPLIVKTVEELDQFGNNSGTGTA